MSILNPWQELFEYSKKCATDSFDDNPIALEYAAVSADYQNKRLSTGIAAISELLDDAIGADRVEDFVAVQICGLLASITGLSLHLAALSSDANSKLAKIIAPRRLTPPATFSHPLILG
ncbi:hypothetical protein SAMN05421862_105201 [Pseudomonas extremaustralis]|uniref:hypothetical protein n=1 Tax=Pseudomonas extremaustralis TaxID=359110 RepID=UPI00099C8844|nr:hypothetical protein [Pseudomonas extremaustralis]SKA88452.1 hypothetical protein SAMN05421862_105201 [Pseudomonas extremaustralis]